ncbi:MAG: nucleotidyltransferase family protein [Chloroflexi bacterium]|nr:nucleotidyltransferase family protein [Chloroflexota bacterium]
MERERTRDREDVDSRAMGVLTAGERALVAGVNGRLPTQADLDWAEVLRLVHIHGVGPLVHRTWSSAGAAVPSEVLTELLLLRRQHAVRSMVSLRERDDAIRILGQAEIPCLVLKGGALARRWYGDVSLRPIADVDLLVPRAEAVPAREALLAAGYRASDERFPSYHDPALERPGSPSSIELHHGLTNLPGLRPLVFEDVCQLAITLDGPDALVRTLGPEDTLVHLCLHALHHVAEDGGWTLLQLCDIVRHLRAFTIDWELFLARARETGLGQGGMAVVSLADLLCGPVVPASHLDPEGAQRLLAYPARQQVLDGYFTHLHALEAAEALDRMAWHEPFALLLRWLREPRSAAAGARSRLSTTPPASRLRVLLREGGWLIRRRLGGSRLARDSLAQGITFVRRQRETAALVNDLLVPK